MLPLYRGQILLGVSLYGFALQLYVRRDDGVTTSSYSLQPLSLKSNFREEDEKNQGPPARKQKNIDVSVFLFFKIELADIKR